ncbi:MAG: DUF4854 domain-containing protein [Clostridiales bacterium]|nr:DUF4854 domain-containing protein [Clostridiales bacterium]
MKKKSVKVLFCSALLAMALVVSACGGKDDKAAESTPTPTEEAKEEEPTEEPTQEPTEAPTEAPAEDAAADTQEDGGRIPAAEEDGSASSVVKFATIEEFVASDELQSQLETMKSAFADSGIDISISGEGNKLIYTYTYQEVENMDGLAEQLAEGMSAQTETFKMVADSITAAVDVENPVVVVTYVDCNGEEIYTEEFTAE